jgi:hypothetical protein
VTVSNYHTLLMPSSSRFITIATNAHYFLIRLLHGIFTDVISRGTFSTPPRWPILSVPGTVSTYHTLLMPSSTRFITPSERSDGARSFVGIKSAPSESGSPSLIRLVSRWIFARRSHRIWREFCGVSCACLMALFGEGKSRNSSFSPRLDRGGPSNIHRELKSQSFISRAAWQRGEVTLRIGLKR